MASDYSLDLRTQVGPKKPEVPKADVSVADHLNQLNKEYEEFEQGLSEVKIKPTQSAPKAIDNLIQERGVEPDFQQQQTQQHHHQYQQGNQDQGMVLDHGFDNDVSESDFNYHESLNDSFQPIASPVNQEVIEPDIRELRAREELDRTPSSHLLEPFKRGVWQGLTNLGMGTLAIPFSLGTSLPVGILESFENNNIWYLYSSIMKARGWSDRHIFDEAEDVGWKELGMGIGLDLLLDPLTYVTLGASGLMRVAGKGGSKVDDVLKAGSRYARLRTSKTGKQVYEYTLSPKGMRLAAEKMREMGWSKKKAGNYLAELIDDGNLEYLHNGGMRWRGGASGIMEDALGVFQLALLPLMVAEGALKMGARGISNATLKGVGQMHPAAKHFIDTELVGLGSKASDWVGDTAIGGWVGSRGNRALDYLGLSETPGIVPKFSQFIDVSSKERYAKGLTVAGVPLFGYGTYAKFEPLKFVSHKVPIIGGAYDYVGNKFSQLYSPIPKQLTKARNYLEEVNRYMQTAVDGHVIGPDGEVIHISRERELKDHPWLFSIAEKNGLVSKALQFPVKHLAFMRRTHDVDIDRIVQEVGHLEAKFLGQHVDFTQDLFREINKLAVARSQQPDGKKVWQERQEIETQVLAASTIDLNDNRVKAKMHEATALEKIRQINNEITDLKNRRLPVEEELDARQELHRELAERYKTLQESGAQQEELLALQTDIDRYENLSNETLKEIEEIKGLIKKQEDEYVEVLNDSLSTLEAIGDQPSALRYLQELHTNETLDEMLGALEHWNGFTLVDNVEELLGTDFRGNVLRDYKGKVLDIEELALKWKAYREGLSTFGTDSAMLADYGGKNAIPNILTKAARTRLSKHIRKLRIQHPEHQGENDHMKLNRIIGRNLGNASLLEINQVKHGHVRTSRQLGDTSEIGGFTGLSIRKEIENIIENIKHHNAEHGINNVKYNSKEDGFSKNMAIELFGQIRAWKKADQDTRVPVNTLVTGKGSIALGFIEDNKNRIENLIYNDADVGAPLKDFGTDFIDGLRVLKKLDRDFGGGIPRLNDTTLFSDDLEYISSMYGQEIASYHTARSFEEKAIKRLGRTQQELQEEWKARDASNKEPDPDNPEAVSRNHILNYGVAGAGGVGTVMTNEDATDEEGNSLPQWVKRGAWVSLGLLGGGAAAFRFRKHHINGKKRAHVMKAAEEAGMSKQFEDLPKKAEEQLVTDYFRRLDSYKRDEQLEAIFERDRVKVVKRFFLGNKDEPQNFNSTAAIINSFNSLPPKRHDLPIGNRGAINTAGKYTPNLMNISVGDQNVNMEEYFWRNVVGLDSEFDIEKLSGHSREVYDAVNDFLNDATFENPFIEYLQHVYTRSTPSSDGFTTRQSSIIDKSDSLLKWIQKLGSDETALGYSPETNKLNNLVNNINTLLSEIEVGKDFKEFDPKFFEELQQEGGYLSQARLKVEAIKSDKEDGLPLGYKFSKDENGKRLETEDGHYIVEPTASLIGFNALRKTKLKDAFRVNEGWKQFTNKIRADNPMFQILSDSVFGDQIYKDGTPPVGRRDIGEEEHYRESVINKDGTRITPEQANSKEHMDTQTKTIVYRPWFDEQGHMHEPLVPLSEEDILGDLDYLQTVASGDEATAAQFGMRELDYDLSNPAITALLHHAYIKLNHEGMQNSAYYETGNISDYTRLKAYRSAQQKFNQSWVFDPVSKTHKLVDAVDEGYTHYENPGDFISQAEAVKMARRGEFENENNKRFIEHYRQEEARLNQEMYDQYLNLWRDWAEQNPLELEKIRAKGFGLLKGSNPNAQGNYYHLTIVNDHHVDGIDTFDGTSITSRRPSAVRLGGSLDEFIVKHPDGWSYDEKALDAEYLQNDFSHRNPEVRTKSMMPHRMLEQIMIETMPKLEEAGVYFDEMIRALGEYNSSEKDPAKFESSLMRLVQLGNPFKEQLWKDTPETISAKIKELDNPIDYPSIARELGDVSLEKVIATKMNEVFGPDWYEEEREGHKPVWAQLNKLIRSMQYHLFPNVDPNLNDPRRRKLVARTWQASFDYATKVRQGWNDWQDAIKYTKANFTPRIGEDNLNLFEHDDRHQPMNIKEAPLTSADQTWNVANTYLYLSELAQVAGLNFSDFIQKVNDAYSYLGSEKAVKQMGLSAWIDQVRTLEDGTTYQDKEHVRGALKNAFTFLQTGKSKRFKESNYFLTDYDQLGKNDIRFLLSSVYRILDNFTDLGVHGDDVLGQYVKANRRKPIAASEVISRRYGFEPRSAETINNQVTAIISSGSEGASEAGVLIGKKHNKILLGNTSKTRKGTTSVSKAELEHLGLIEYDIPDDEKIGILPANVEPKDIFEARPDVAHDESAAGVYQGGEIHAVDSLSRFYERDHIEVDYLEFMSNDYNNLGPFKQGPVDPNTGASIAIHPDDLNDVFYMSIGHPYADIRNDDKEHLEVITFADLNPIQKAVYAAGRREVKNQILANKTAQKEGGIGGTIVFKGEDHTESLTVDDDGYTTNKTSRIYESLAEKTSFVKSGNHPIFKIEGGLEGGNLDLLTSGKLDVHKLDKLVAEVRGWIVENNIKAINISGSLESKSPAIRNKAMVILNKVFSDEIPEKDFVWRHGTNEETDNFLFDIGSRMQGMIPSKKFRPKIFKNSTIVSQDGQQTKADIDDVHLLQNKGWDGLIFSNPKWGDSATNVMMNINVFGDRDGGKSISRAAQNHIRNIEKNVAIKSRMFSDEDIRQQSAGYIQTETGKELVELDDQNYLFDTDVVISWDTLGNKSRKVILESIFEEKITYEEASKAKLNNETIDETKARLASELVSSLAGRIDEDRGITRGVDYIVEDSFDMIEATGPEADYDIEDYLSSGDRQRMQEILDSYLPDNEVSRRWYTQLTPEQQGEAYYKLFEDALDPEIDIDGNVVEDSLKTKNSKLLTKQIIDHYGRYGQLVSSQYITSNKNNPQFFMNPAMAIARYMNDPEKGFAKPYTQDELSELFKPGMGGYDTLSTKVAQDLGMFRRDAVIPDPIDQDIRTGIKVIPEGPDEFVNVKGFHFEHVWDHIGRMVSDPKKRARLFNQFLEGMISRVPLEARPKFFSGQGEGGNFTPSGIRNDIQFLLANVFYEWGDTKYINNELMADISLRILANIGGDEVYRDVKNRFLRLFNDYDISVKKKVENVGKLITFSKEIANTSRIEPLSEEDISRLYHFLIYNSRPSNEKINTKEGRSQDGNTIIVPEIPNDNLRDNVKRATDPNIENQRLKNIDKQLSKAYEKDWETNASQRTQPVHRQLIHELKNGDTELLTHLVRHALNLNGDGLDKSANQIINEFIQGDPYKANDIITTLYRQRMAKKVRTDVSGREWKLPLSTIDRHLKHLVEKVLPVHTKQNPDTFTADLVGTDQFSGNIPERNIPQVTGPVKTSVQESVHGTMDFASIDPDIMKSHGLEAAQDALLERELGMHSIKLSMDQQKQNQDETLMKVVDTMGHEVAPGRALHRKGLTLEVTETEGVRSERILKQEQEEFDNQYNDIVTNEQHDIADQEINRSEGEDFTKGQKGPHDLNDHFNNQGNTTANDFYSSSSPTTQLKEGVGVRYTKTTTGSDILSNDKTPQLKRITTYLTNFVRNNLGIGYAEPIVETTRTVMPLPGAANKNKLSAAYNFKFNGITEDQIQIRFDLDPESQQVLGVRNLQWVFERLYSRITGKQLIRKRGPSPSNFDGLSSFNESDEIEEFDKVFQSNSLYEETFGEANEIVPVTEEYQSLSYEPTAEEAEQGIVGHELEYYDTSSYEKEVDQEIRDIEKENQAESISDDVEGSSNKDILNRMKASAEDNEAAADIINQQYGIPSTKKVLDNEDFANLLKKSKQQYEEEQGGEGRLPRIFDRKTIKPLGLKGWLEKASDPEYINTGRYFINQQSGWKIHLASNRKVKGNENNSTLANALRSIGIREPYFKGDEKDGKGWGFEQGGKDITIYVGHRDDMLAVANYIESKLGDSGLLLRQEEVESHGYTQGRASEVLTGNEQVSKHAWARYTEPEVHQGNGLGAWPRTNYGREGIPSSNESLQYGSRWKELAFKKERTPEEQTELDRLRKEDKVKQTADLTTSDGQFFTGSNAKKRPGFYKKGTQPVLIPKSRQEPETFEQNLTNKIALHNTSAMLDRFLNELPPDIETEEALQKYLDELDLDLLPPVSGGVGSISDEVPPGMIRDRKTGEVWGSPRTIRDDNEGYKRDGQRLLLNPFHRSMVERATGIMNSPEKLAGFMKVYDFVHNFYKAYTLFPFPAYHVRNVIDSGLWRGYLSGNTDVRNYVVGKHLADLKRESEPEERTRLLKSIGKIDDRDANQILRLAQEYGVIRESSTKDMLDVTSSNLAGVDGGGKDLARFIRDEELANATTIEDLPDDVQELARLLQAKKRNQGGSSHHVYDDVIRESADNVQSAIPEAFDDIKSGLSKIADTAGTILYPFRAVKAAKDLGLKANDYLEDMVRLSQFTDGLRKGWSPEIAAGYTKEVHFDYRDLSNFENNVMRRLFPWYAFVNKNLPFNIRMQTGQMNKYAWFHHAYSNWWKANPFTEEEDYENGGSLPSPKDMASWQSGRLPIMIGKGKEKTFGGGSTYYVKYLKDWFSVYNLTALSPQDLTRAAWGELTPLAKAPINWWRNYDEMRSRQDNKTELYEGETTSFLGMRMPRRSVQLLRQARLLALADRMNPGGIFGRKYSPTSGKTNVAPNKHVSKGMAWLTNTFTPFTAIADNSPEGRRYDESAALKFLALFDGGIKFFDPLAFRKYQEWGEEEEARAPAVGSAGKFTYDYDVDTTKLTYKRTSNDDDEMSQAFDSAIYKNRKHQEYLGKRLKSAKHLTQWQPQRGSKGKTVSGFHPPETRSENLISEISTALEGLKSQGDKLRIEKDILDNE